MLRRIVQLEHVGLFHSATPEPLDLHKTTLIYGENGRGKSTLSAVLDSCARNRPDLILNRRTIDEPMATPAVQLIFDGGRRQVNFANGAWDAQRPDIHVFDSQFVHECVHTGLQILSPNRLALYEFALGDAVEDLRGIEAAGDAAREATQRARDLERVLRTHAEHIDVASFRDLAQQPDAEARLLDLNRQLTAANSANAILRRADLVPLRLPDLNLDDLFALLQRTLPDVHEDAERRVREHMARHAIDGVENWISRGLVFENGSDCPYCGQAVVELPLLAAYRDFFDAAYGELKNQVSTVLANVKPQFGAWTGRHWMDQVYGNRARQDAWTDLVPSEHVPYNEPEGARDLDGILEPVERLLERKIANPLEPVGTPQDRERIEEARRTMMRRLDLYNQAIGALNERYAAAKREIEAGDAASIQRDIRDVQKAHLRHRADVAQLVTDLAQAEVDGTNAAQRKEQLREEHDRRMADILGRYQEAINERLRRLRAGFRIQQLRGGHAAGQAPRTMYAIQLRGATITNLEHAADGPSVPNVLSDGDRRALALAFFLARLDINDAAIANAIIVFDDPMTSFDTTRTGETITALTEVAARCRQLIVLSHDAYFLRDLSRALGNDIAQRATYKIGYGDRDYAVFGTCDLTETCGQSHVIHQKAIADYLAGRALDPRPPAEGLRILVEDFYKHRYPHHTHDLTTLGDIIQAADGVAPTPLHALRHLLPALRDFNAYASRYHHSTQGYRTTPIIEDRLRHYCRGALSLVHDEGRSYPLV